ncbi:hypothetical protein KQI65_16970 [bacterium]|nr:hypothetical protein [bacterium]
MKRTIPILAFIVTILFTTGCIETHTLIQLKKDGSGTMKETVKMNKAVAGMLQGMGESMKNAFEDQGADDGEDMEPAESPEPPEPMFSEEEVREKMENMGPGVELLAYEDIDEGGSIGYTATYSFPDINELRVSEDPESSMPASDEDEIAEMEMSEEQGKDDFLQFHLAPGSPAELEIIIPEKEEKETIDVEVADGEDADGGEGEDGGQDMMENIDMKQFFRGMRIYIGIEFEGSIQETNAHFVDGNIITLMDVDLDKVIAQEGAFEELQKSNSMNPADARDLLSTIPGVRVETENTVNVTFD